MSVLIKDMNMPETCDDCKFHRYHSYGEYVCVATPMFYPMNLANSKGIRKDWCPLVALPEKHGRLIDGDELKTALPRCDNNMDIKIASVRATVNHMPTIIEAEGAEE